MKTITTSKKASAILESDYPSIKLAYPIAVESYKIAVSRFDALDTKIQNMMSFALTAFLIIPTVGNFNRVSFNSWLFATSMFLLIVSLTISIIARKNGRVKLLDPKAIYEGWLHLPPIQFQKDLIYFAGSDFDQTISLNERKWKMNLISLTFFSVALLAGLLWASGLPM